MLSLLSLDSPTFGVTRRVLWAPVLCYKVNGFGDLVNAQVHGICGMNDCELISGRPFGGVAFICKSSLLCKIIPIPLSSCRVCAVLVSINGHTIMLFNV